jgi:hypothetical protein
MDRRSPPQKKLDDRAFRVGVHMLMPERGFANPLLDMHRCSTPKSAGATSPRTARQRPRRMLLPSKPALAADDDAVRESVREPAERALASRLHARIEVISVF